MYMVKHGKMADRRERLLKGNSKASQTQGPAIDLAHEFLGGMALIPYTSIYLFALVVYFLRAYNLQ